MAVWVVPAFPRSCLLWRFRLWVVFLCVDRCSGLLSEMALILALFEFRHDVAPYWVYSMRWRFRLLRGVRLNMRACSGLRNDLGDYRP